MTALLLTYTREERMELNKRWLITTTGEDGLLIHWYNVDRVILAVEYGTTVASVWGFSNASHQEHMEDQFTYDDLSLETIAEHECFGWWNKSETRDLDWALEAVGKFWSNGESVAAELRSWLTVRAVAR